jgi:hypothetical protein
VSDRKLLKRLEALEAQAKATASARPGEVVFLDDEGRIMADGTRAMEPWVGKTLSDWPAEWRDRPHPVKLIQGVDPIVLLGLDLAPREEWPRLLGGR